MANPAVITFDEVLQAGRKKRRAEALAQQFFGKNRRSTAPDAARLKGRRNEAAASLASRVGVAKRSQSTTSINRANGRRNTELFNTSRAERSPAAQTTQLNNAARAARNARLTSALSGTASNSSQDRRANRHTAKNDIGQELSIRGAAGPYVVVASNFAPGTTAADIESVMQSVGGEMLGCKIIASAPTVIAEMTFVEKSGAEQVIETFNNRKVSYVRSNWSLKHHTKLTDDCSGTWQRSKFGLCNLSKALLTSLAQADGRMLYVYMKAHYAPTPSAAAYSERPTNRNSTTNPTSAPAPAPAQEEDAVMDIDDGEISGAQDSDPPAPQSRPTTYDEYQRNGRDDRPYQDYSRQPRRAEPEYEEGRFGFPNGRGGGRYAGRGQYDRGGRYNNEGRMYSDGAARRGGQSYRP
ncbi:hypothetical protein LTR66_007941 [Elasticomyces elasticus]|nr:hypothetical protein LTR66_007941 [Elasticomyces elasticus]